MPPAANARALDPGRLTLTSFGSPSDGKIFPTEADRLVETGKLPPATARGHIF
ncbi:MAG: hypothetical protein LBQ54_06270 [Planctomycetaceae bacterium]|nr:hypothetical protein [Planctomycetaceae bacterium]